MKPIILGLDLGTTLCKAAAFELDGTLRASSQSTITTSRPFPGWAEQNAREWIAAFRKVIRDVTTQLGVEKQRIRAIGTSSHGPCLIPTDDKFQPLMMAPIWQDQRGADLCSPLIDLVGNDWVGLGMPESAFAVKVIWALRNKAEVIEEAKYLFDTKGFILASLTGRIVDDVSSSPGGRSWNRATYEGLGVDTAKMTETLPSLSVVGPLLPSVADDFNLPRDVQVIAGLNDGAAATLGAGVIHEGQGILSLSTNGVMRTLTPDRIPGKTLLDNSMFCYSYVNDLFVSGGTTRSGGDSVQWFIDVFLRGCNPQEYFDQITRDAMASPVGANGVMFMPYLMGMGSPYDAIASQGAFINLGRHHKREDLTRALLEGIAFSLRDIGERFTQLGWRWENLRFTGGGSKNLAWRQIVADIIKKPLCGIKTDSVLGAAMTVIPTIDQKISINAVVDEWVHPFFEVEPVPENVKRYDEIYQEYIEVRNGILEQNLARQGV